VTNRISQGRPTGPDRKSFQ